MVPYVRKSFYKHFMNGCRWVVPDTMENCMHMHYENENWKEFFENEPIDGPKYTEPEFQKAYAYAMEMTKKEIYQAAEALFHNLNSLQSRSR